MLPSPYARLQNLEFQNIAPYPDPQQQPLGGGLPASYLSRYSNSGAVPLLNLNSPYRANDSSTQTLETVQQQIHQQDNLLRRKIPPTTPSATYNGIGMGRPTRPHKHTPILPLSAAQQVQLNHNLLPEAPSNFPLLQSQDSGIGMGSVMDLPSETPDYWPIQTPILWPHLDLQHRDTAPSYSHSPAQQEHVVFSQMNGFQTPDFLPTGAIYTQQTEDASNSVHIADRPIAGEIGTDCPLPQGFGWNMLNDNGLYGQSSNIPLQQQPISQLYQINSPFTPTDLQHYPSLYGSVPAWNQRFKRNSGQAQTPQIINAPVTSPYNMAPFHPFVADPIHHTQGYMLGGTYSSPPYIQTPEPARARVLAWAHGVYADLVHAAQAQKLSQAPHNNLQFPRPPVQPLAKTENINPATFENEKKSIQSTSYSPLTPRSRQSHSTDLTDDNLDRRKKRRLDFQTSSSHVKTNTFTTQTNIQGGSDSITLVDNPDYRNWPAHQFGGSQFQRAEKNSETIFSPPMNGIITYSNNSIQFDNNGALPQTSYGMLGQSQPIGGVCGIVSPPAAKIAGQHALETLQHLCAESGWQWLDGMLLGGCIAHALNDLNSALGWYTRIIEVDPLHVEALTNMGATLLALGRRSEAEAHWLKAVKSKPNYFEAVEHLVSLLCGDLRGGDAVALIEHVERSVKRRTEPALNECSMSICSSSSECSRTSSSPEMLFNYLRDEEPSTPIPTIPQQPEFTISAEDNGRLLALIHAKGNMLYTLGNNVAAAKAFEDAVLVGAGRDKHGIKGLIDSILKVLSPETNGYGMVGRASQPILLTPERALKTAQLVFPPNGELPGLRDVPQGPSRRIAISTTSNSLLSLAKIFQDGMSSSSTSSGLFAAGVKEILALYYLSLSLHPSPSTANNVGILLASVQQVAPIPHVPQLSNLPGHNSGVSLALLYYQYGLMLDSRHAHLYTNLGSLLKDINNLPMAIKMYEQAVLCDGTFDIALANLANAVKDQGKTNEAIKYYKRAVAVNPNFAEAVCGLANALNSVCDWKGRGGVVTPNSTIDRWHVDDDGSLCDAQSAGAVSKGWMSRVVGIVEKQLKEGENWGRGILTPLVIDNLLREVEIAVGGSWDEGRRKGLRRMLTGWAGKKNEGSKVVRLIERAIRRAGWRWYQERHIKRQKMPFNSYTRPTMPVGLSIPSAPTVLPFHTFTCPLSAQQVRMISQRNGIRISCSAMRSPWVSTHVYPPPAPPAPHINVGYISSDFNNHPLAHLMQSVFGMHDITKVKAHCYATTPSDGSIHRQQIQREAPVFHDASCWGPDRLIEQIISDGIHILVNLNGFTRGAKNEIFAARPAPIQMSFMGFAGTLGADWCDYLLADTTAVPPETLRPWRRNVDLEDGNHVEEDEGDWVYCENIVFTKHTFFCCDHRQSAPDASGPRYSWIEEQKRRWTMRKKLFPDLPDDAVILGNFNQLYKIEPTTFRTWLRIILKVPNARLWLLRFPEQGEHHLRELAVKWAGNEVASRIIFTDVAPKQHHISRARVCDVFLDTPECNAHTTAADVTWSGTPLLTFPRHTYKMCSRIAASIVRAAVPEGLEGGKERIERLIVGSEEEYEERAIELASGLKYSVTKVPRVASQNQSQSQSLSVNAVVQTALASSKGAIQAKMVKAERVVEVDVLDMQVKDVDAEMEEIVTATGELVEMRKILYEGRWTSPLFDTRRWVRDLERAYEQAWGRWVEGKGGDIWL